MDRPIGYFEIKIGMTNDLYRICVYKCVSEPVQCIESDSLLTQ